VTAKELVAEFRKMCPLSYAQRDILVRMFDCAIEEEREACAKILDREADECEWYNHSLFERIAEAIRARSEVKK
jgi:hypothetical protein